MTIVREDDFDVIALALQVRTCISCLPFDGKIRNAYIFDGIRIFIPINYTTVVSFICCFLEKLWTTKCNSNHLTSLIVYVSQWPNIESNHNSLIIKFTALTQSHSAIFKFIEVLSRVVILCVILHYIFFSTFSIYFNFRHRCLAFHFDKSIEPVVFAFTCESDVQVMKSCGATIRRCQQTTSTIRNVCLYIQ